MPSGRSQVINQPEGAGRVFLASGQSWSVQGNLRTNRKGDAGREAAGEAQGPPSTEPPGRHLLPVKQKGARSPQKPLQPDVKRPRGQTRGRMRAPCLPARLTPARARVGRRGARLRALTQGRRWPASAISARDALRSNIQLLGKEHGDCTRDIFTVRPGSGACHLMAVGQNSFPRT